MASPVWSTDSWKEFPAAQQPSWDKDELAQVIDTIKKIPPLVFGGEIRSLRDTLANVEQRKGFVLIAGDCAESFDAFNSPSIREKLRIILQMAVILTFSGGVPVTKIGRIAGQFGKPRSDDFEVRDGVSLPSYRGDNVNGFEFTPESRIPDPKRLLQGYHQSASTLNLLRAFTKGGFADLGRVHSWNQEFVSTTEEGHRYEKIAQDITRAMNFMRACGIDPETHQQLHEVDFYTSHEGLLLDYEEALTRVDSTNGEYYDCSAHLVWIGDRTRQIDGAHVEFFRGINNPVAVKLGITATANETIELLDALNPNKEVGKIILTLRAGADNIKDTAIPIMKEVVKSGHPVTWMSDPMHGNTFKHQSGYKTRHFDDIMREIEGFFSACLEAKVWPGGIHLELTGDNVTECLGGLDHLDALDSRYETRCDPRLNARQGLDIAFRVAELLGSQQ